MHTEHVGKLGWYEWIFVTPSNHRVHHAQNERYLDRNYGGLFILWDRLFGTFQEELDSDPPIYGITGPLRSFNPLRALTHIYADMFRDSWKAQRWRDKFYVWVARTGWRPADLEASDPRPKSNLADFVYRMSERRVGYIMIFFYSIQHIKKLLFSYLGTQTVTLTLG